MPLALQWVRGANLIPMKQEPIEFRIPSWALCALINGDNSGLTDEDQAKLDQFVNKTVEKYGNANFCIQDEDKNESGFYHSNDIDRLGSDCETLLLIPTKETK